MMFRINYVAMLMMSLSLLVLGQLEDEEDGWIDPGDMLNYDSGAKKMIKTPAYNPPEKQPTSETCEKCDCDEKIEALETDLGKCRREKDLADEPESPGICDGQGGNEGLFFRQYIRSLLMSFPSEGSYQTQITLAEADLLALRQFASTEGGRVEDAHHVLLNMADHVLPLENPVYLTHRQKLENFLGIDLASLFMVLGAIMMCSITLSVVVRIHVPWSQIMWKLLLTSFIMSIPWNWWFLYKKAVAKRHADLLKDVPAECNPKDQTAAQSFFQWFASSFTFSSDACAKYHEKMLVDPIWEVPPTQAVAVTLSKFFVEPLEHIGIAVKLMIRGLLEDMPIHMWPVVIFLFIFLTAFILVLLCGYRIRLFWNIFGLEPGNPAPQAAPPPLQQVAPPQPIHLVLQDAGGPHRPENISYQGAIQNIPASQSTEEDSRRPPVSVSYRPPASHPQTPRHPDTPDGNIGDGRGAQPRPPTVPADSYTNQPVPAEPHTNHPVHADPHTNQPVPTEPHTNHPVPTEPHTNHPVPTEPHTNHPVPAGAHPNQRTVPAEPHTNHPVPAGAHTSAEPHSRGAEGVNRPQLHSGESGDGAHTEPFLGGAPQSTHDTVRSSEQLERCSPERQVSQEAAYLPGTVAHTEQRHGGLGTPPGGMGDDPSVKCEVLPTQEEESNGTHTEVAAGGTAAAVPSTQLETEEDFGSFEFLDPNEEGGEPVNVQSAVEDLGPTQPNL